jgi:plasmid maintenance system killer protein
MKQFEDERVREIYHTRFARGLSQRLTEAVHEAVRLLVASGSLSDVRVIGPIVRWPNAPDRYGLHINGKWHVTFAWSEDKGAYAIRLERK